MAFIEFKNVSKTYQLGEVEIEALKKINFQIEEGELVVILGSSGAGKTTILNLLGGMDNCTKGTITMYGNDITKYDEKQLVGYRRHDVGFVFQFYNLLPNLTAIENVLVASQITRNPLDAKQVLVQVGLESRMDHFPSQLSGGEQQRVSIARAIAKNPKLLLCDEPTGALDYVTGKKVLKLLQKLCYETKKTIVIITHNSEIAKIANRVIKVHSGEISEIKLNDVPLDVDEVEW